jgi:PEP-CTERM motif
MGLRKLTLGLAGGVSMLALAPVADAATVIPIGSPNFFITAGSPFADHITAVFFDSFMSTSTFDDIFTFTLPQNGVGSGSISTTFSGLLNKLTITSLTFDGTSIPVPSNSSGQSTSDGGVTIAAGVLNSLEVKGFTLGAGSFAGVATFTAAVPEPAAWALMVGGFGMIGWSMRRRRVNVAYA